MLAVGASPALGSFSHDHVLVVGAEEGELVEGEVGAAARLVAEVPPVPFDHLAALEVLLVDALPDIDSQHPNGEVAQDVGQVDTGVELLPGHLPAEHAEEEQQGPGQGRQVEVPRVLVVAEMQRRQHVQWVLALADPEGCQVHVEAGRREEDGIGANGPAVAEGTEVEVGIP